MHAAMYYVDTDSQTASSILPVRKSTDLAEGRSDKVRRYSNVNIVPHVVSRETRPAYLRGCLSRPSDHLERPWLPQGSRGLYMPTSSSDLSGHSRNREASRQIEGCLAVPMPTVESPDVDRYLHRLCLGDSSDHSLEACRLSIEELCIWPGPWIPIPL